jgi:coatomer protein complex subunit epsilon
MDAYSDSGELFVIQQAYYTGEYQQVISTDVSRYSDEGKVKAQVLIYRAKIQVGKANEVIQELEKKKGVVDFEIVKAYAEYQKNSKNKALSTVEEIISKHKDNGTVQFIGGLVLISEGKYDEALQLLSNHEGSLECVSLIVEIYLRTDRIEEAEKQVRDAKKWAQDNIVFNLTEAWVDLKVGGSDKYQNAYYIFEELNGRTVKSLSGQAVSQLQMNRIPEAQEAIDEALKLDPSNTNVLANNITLNIINGKDYGDIESNLEQVEKDHPNLVDLQAKSQLFDKIVEKYSKQIAA